MKRRDIAIWSMGAVLVFAAVWGFLTLAMRARTAVARARTASAPVAQVPVAYPSSPPVPPLERALRRMDAGETLAPADCLDLIDAVIPAPMNARLWPLLECQWRANRSLGATVVFGAAIKSEAAHTPIPPERVELVREVTLWIANNPRELLPPAFDGSYATVERGQIENVEYMLGRLPEVCPECSRARPLADALRLLRQRIEAFPVDVSDVRALQLRQPDLRGRLARIDGFVLADTYYNCKYRSSTQWRSMRLRDSVRDFNRMNVYCRRGDEVCDSVYEVAMTGNFEGTAIVRYPESNRICEASQAELVDFVAANP